MFPTHFLALTLVTCSLARSSNGPMGPMKPGDYPVPQSPSQDVTVVNKQIHKPMPAGEVTVAPDHKNASNEIEEKPGEFGKHHPEPKLVVDSSSSSSSDEDEDKLLPRNRTQSLAGDSSSSESSENSSSEEATEKISNPKQRTAANGKGATQGKGPSSNNGGLNSGTPSNIRDPINNQSSGKPNSPSSTAFKPSGKPNSTGSGFSAQGDGKVETENDSPPLQPEEPCDEQHNHAMGQGAMGGLIPPNSFGANGQGWSSSGSWDNQDGVQPLFPWLDPNYWTGQKPSGSNVGAPPSNGFASWTDGHATWNSANAKPKPGKNNA